MVWSSVAFVLRTTKYGDTSLILQCYSQERGAISCIKKGFFSGKKRSLSAIMPLSKVDLSLRDSKNSNVYSIQNIGALSEINWLNKHPVKQSIILFLSEVLTQCLRDEDADPDVWNFLEGFLRDFHDHNAWKSDFHIVFLLQLSAVLGFKPDNQNPYGQFDLLEGQFSGRSSGNFLLNPQESNLFSKAMYISFDKLEAGFTTQERRQLLAILMQYFKLHISGFREPKSMEVLHAMFR